MEKTKDKCDGKRRVKKMFLIVLGIIVACIVAIAIFVAITANRNVSAMNRCIDGVLEELEKNYRLTPYEETGYEEMKLYGLVKFNVEQYRIEGVGNLSVMRVNMGVMQMGTLVISPFDKNLPLVSVDYMYILSSRKCYLEFYDVVKEKDEQYNQLLNSLAEVKEKYSYIDDMETSETWYQDLLTVVSYKTGKSDMDEDLYGLLMDSMDAYIGQSKEFPVLSEDAKAEKKEITQEYTDGLIEKGGISTDVFKQELGEEETKKFFDNVFFGTTAK